MDVYPIVMCCLSSFGFFIIFFSMFLLITVPTKLTAFSRFVIHGHDVVTSFTQLYITLGLQPYIILPCTSGYTAGVFTRFGILSTINQSWGLVALITMSSASSLLLVVHRVLAVSVSLSVRRKNIILILFFSQLLAQLICVVVTGLNFKDDGEKARDICMKKLKDYPKEMDTFNGLNFIFTDNPEFIGAIVYTVLCTVFYLTVASVCGMILVRSIKRQAKSSQSVKFLANQRRITVGIIYFGIVEIVAVGVPVSVLTVCGCLSAGNVAVSQYSMISMAFYPICGPYYVLMSNSDYRKRITEIITRGTTHYSLLCSFLREREARNENLYSSKDKNSSSCKYKLVVLSCILSGRTQLSTVYR